MHATKYCIIMEQIYFFRIIYIWQMEASVWNVVNAYLNIVNFCWVNFSVALRTISNHHILGFVKGTILFIFFAKYDFAGIMLQYHNTCKHSVEIIIHICTYLSIQLRLKDIIVELYDLLIGIRLVKQIWSISILLFSACPVCKVHQGI